MDIPWEIIPLLFLVGTLAGWVDTIAGGGGLLTLPALLLTGIPPQVAVATNKLQSSSGTFVSSSYFIKKNLVNPWQNKRLIFAAFAGSVSGSALILVVSSDFLKWVVPFLLFGAGCYFLFSLDVKDVHGRERISSRLFTWAIIPILGFYDGFFGPGAGAFMSLSFIALRGFPVLQATSHTKLINFTTNVSSFLYFLFFGEIYWTLGFAMITGQILGSTISARMVIAKGAKLVKPILVVVCFTMSLVYVFKIMDSPIMEFNFLQQ